MDISSTATETIQSKQTINDTQSVQNADKVSDAVKTEEKKENKQDTQSDFQKLLEEPKSTDKISIEQLPQENLNQMSVNEQYANKFSFDTVSSIKNLQSVYNYDTISISKDDAKFFADLVENKQFALQQNGDTQNLIKFADEIGPTYKAQQTSQVLTNLISKAYNEQKPIRIDFDNNVSVILKVDSKGKVSADFIPGDKAVEAYLKNNIEFLKMRFDDRNIAYNELTYRQSQNGNKHREQQNQQKNKGE